MNEMCYTYCKFADEKKFTAYDLNEGIPCGNLIRCTLLLPNEENKRKLQELADLNKEQGLVIQLRTDKQKVVFQTI